MQRYLWAPGVDQILADEVQNRWMAGNRVIDWAITDGQGSVGLYVEGGGILTEDMYSVFGVKTSYNPGMDMLFGYAAGYTDPDTGLIWYGVRSRANRSLMNRAVRFF